MTSGSFGGSLRPVLTDAEIELGLKRVALEREEHELETERENRSLRRWIARGVLAVMAIQIAGANAVFVWYGDTNAWDIPGTTISAWLGATVVQIVAVVLVVMRYLFPPKN